MKPETASQTLRLIGATTVYLKTMLVIILSMLGLAACNSGGGDSSGGGNPGTGSGVVSVPTPSVRERAVFVNPTDATLYSFSTTTGEKLTYFGRRDAGGNASVLTMLDYVDADGKPFTLFFDTYGLPAKVVDAEGTTVELDYGLPAATSPSKGLKAPANSGPVNISSVGVKVTSRSSDDIPLEVRTQVALDKPVVVDLDQFIVDENLKEPAGNAAVTVSQCDEPVNPHGGVLVNYRGASSTISRYPAFPTSTPGRYVSWIPQRNPDPVPANLEAICSAFADTLDAACHVFNPTTAGPGAVLLSDPGFQIALCGQITAAVSLSATPVAGASAGAACVALLAGGTLACDTLGWSFPWQPPLPDENNITQQLCGQVEETLNGIDSALGLDTAFIQAVADFSAGTPAISAPGENTGVFASGEQEVSAFGPFPTLEINPSEPTIDSFTAPASPESGTGYSATAELSCVQGAELSISVIRDVTTIFGPDFRTATMKNESMTVDVPAEPAGKVDTLLVSAVNNTTKKSVHRKFSVLFKEPLPVVTVAASDAAAAEPGNTGAFTLTRTGNTGTALTVKFTLSGSAARGTDYTVADAVSATIPAGAAAAVVTVTPVDDTAEESSETVILTIQADARYTVGASNAATVNIADNDANNYVFGEASCPAGLSAKLRSDGTPATLLFKRFEDNSFMDEASCYYQQEGNPFNFETGMWLDYGQSAGACGQGNGIDEVVLTTSPPDSLGYIFVTAASTLRTAEVTFFATDSYYQYQNYEPALIEFVNNAVKGSMGSACP